MCTFTWWPCADGYGFFFNRDELNTRVAELPPARDESGGLVHLAPRDGPTGGTWMGVNERGISVVLLNDYTVTWRPSSPALSRGALVKAALGARTLEGVGRLVADFDVSRTGAFRLIALARTGAVHVYHWDGECLDHTSGDDVDCFFSSSSYHPREVIASRRAAYDRLANKSDESSLRALHWAHEPTAGAYSVLMRRPDAATRSVCEVQVGAHEANLSYTPVVWAGDALSTSHTSVLSLPLK